MLTARLLADKVSLLDLCGHDLIVTRRGRLWPMGIAAALDTAASIADLIEPVWGAAVL